MDKIKSFQLNHNEHKIGFYLSQINGDVFTYDLRFKTPNAGDYLSVPALHSIEHIFATVIRNSNIKNDVIYFGPMGCRTGFYLLLRGIAYDEARAITVNTLKLALEVNTVPGNKKIECGNYRSHNIKAAKTEMERYLKALL